MESAMRRWHLLCALGALCMGSCATDDPEADAFFRRGWLWPKDLDKAHEQPPPTDDSAPARREPR